LTGPQFENSDGESRQGGISTKMSHQPLAEMQDCPIHFPFDEVQET
jgi:hypothetical protein